MHRPRGRRSARFRLLTISLAAARRSLGRLAVFGLVLLLAVGLIVAQGVAGNVAAGEVLRQSVEVLPYDFEGDVLTSFPHDVSSSLSSIGTVVAVTYGFWVSVGALGRNAGKDVRLFIAGVADTFPDLAVNMGWEGDFNLSPGTTVLSVRAASQLGAGIGSMVQLGDERCDPFNGTCIFQGRSYTVSGLVRDTKEGSALAFPFEAFLTESDGMSLFDLMYGQTSGPPPSENQLFRTFMIWVDRESLLSPLDPYGSIQRVAQTRIRLEVTAGAANVRSPLEDALRSYPSRLASLQGFFLAITVPSLVLAAAFGLTALDRTTHEALGSIRLMRIRGMGRPKALTLLTIPPALVAAATVAVAGISLPMAFEAVLLQVGPFQDLVFTYPSWSFDGIPALSFVAGTALFLSIFGMHLHSVAARLAQPSSKWQNTPIGRDGAPLRRDLVLVLPAVALWTYSTFHELILRITPGADLVLGGLVTALIPLAGIFLVGGLTRPILRVRRFRVAVGKGGALFAGVLGRRYLPDRLSRSVPSARVPLLVAIAVSLVLLTLTSFASEEAFEGERTIALLGGDMLVDAYGTQDLSGTRHLGENLSRIPGIRNVAEVNLSPPVFSPVGQLVLANMPSYQSVVAPDPYFFGTLGGDIATILRGPAVVVNLAAREQTGLVVGNEIPVRYGTSHVESVRIVGVVPALPGLQPPWAEDFRTPLLYGDIASFQDLFPEVALNGTSPSRFLLKLETDASPDALVDTILLTMPQVARVLHAGTKPLAMSVGTIARPFVALEAFFSYALVLLASASMMSTLLSGKRAEIATLRARGANRAAVAKLMSGEIASSLAFGFLVGTLSGLASSWFFVDSLSKLVDPFPLPRPFVLSPNLILSLGLLALSLVGILAAVSWMSSNPNLAGEIRERSQ